MRQSDEENNPRIVLRTDDGENVLPDAADVAEVAEGRLMVASLDGDREMMGGWIFGAFGRWKMWHETPSGDVEQYLAERPFTVPPGVTRFRYHDGDGWKKHERSGRIKRLKRADL